MVKKTLNKIKNLWVFSLPYSINFGALGFDDSKNEYFWINNIGKDFYWENIGGSFKLNHDKNDYKN